MKWVFVVVLILNLASAAYGLLTMGAPSDIHSQEVNPAMLHILPSGWKPPLEPEGVASSLPASTVLGDTAVLSPPAQLGSGPVPLAPTESAMSQADAATELACFEWRALDERLLAQVKSELPTARLTAQQWSQVGNGVGRSKTQYWVYYPPGTPRSEVRALSLELKRKGFDNYVVRHDVKLSDAISFGVFAREKAANALLTRLKAAGYGQVKVAIRGPHAVLAFRNLNQVQVGWLINLQKRLAPQAPIKRVSCS